MAMNNAMAVVLAGFACSLVLLSSCSRSERAATHSVVTTAAADTAAAPVEREVKVSPEVAALLAPDPDLDGTISPEEVRATLEAAAAHAPSTVPSTPGAPRVGASAEWRDLEQQKKHVDSAYERKLDSTTVYAASGSDSYHRSGCAALYRVEVLRDGTTRRTYMGTGITLRRARDARMTAHNDCGAPSYDFSYRDAS